MWTVWDFLFSTSKRAGDMDKRNDILSSLTRHGRTTTLFMYGKLTRYALQAWCRRSLISWVQRTEAMQRHIHYDAEVVNDAVFPPLMFSASPCGFLNNQAGQLINLLVIRPLIHPRLRLCFQQITRSSSCRRRGPTHTAACCSEIPS